MLYYLTNNYRELLEQLQKAVSKLAGMPGNKPEDSELPSSPDGTSTSPRILKTSHDLKALKNVVKRKVEESLDDIIDETAG